MPKQCKHPNCTNPVFSKMLCKWHYNLPKYQSATDDKKAPHKSANTARKPIAKQSAKRKKLDAAYSVLAKSFKQRHPHCMARLDGCTGITSDVHHMRGRNIYLLDETEFLLVCRNCHSWIELHPAQAKELGFSKNRLDP